MTLRIYGVIVSAAVLSLAASVRAQVSPISARDTAAALAQSGLRVGAIMSLSDFLRSETGSGRNPGAAAQASGLPTSNDGVDGTLARFREQHPEFLVQRTATSVRLVRQDTPAEVLDRLTRSGITTSRDQIPVSAALVEVVGSLINQRVVSGVLGSGQMPGPGCPLGAPVRVAAGQATPLDTLDSLVSQVPGLSWFVLYDAERVQDPLHVGLSCQDGMYFRVQLPRSV